MLAHGSARQVLIIGGGDGGCLREAVKHPSVEQVTQVEIDAGVIEFCKKYLPTLSDGAFEHPKARVVIADGARFAAETQDRYDVIIADSTDPQGPGAVLFTGEFYRNCRRLLNEGGIMVTQCGNPAIHPDELEVTQARQRAAGFGDVTYYFAAVATYIGANMALGFASDDLTLKDIGAAEIARRTVPPDLRYYTPEMHQAAFAHPAWMKRRIGY